MYLDRINQTIAAIATCSGSSIGIIRISGSKAHCVAREISGKKNISHMKASLINIEIGNKLVEKCLMIPFFSPHSFTGEDVIEFHVHGADLQAQEILKLILSYNILPALNGEFSFRSVMNGKMDISEAMGISTIITASDKLTLDFARKESFEHTLYNNISELQNSWENFYIISTSILDFPEQVKDFLPSDQIHDVIDNTLKNIYAINNNTEKLSIFSHFSLVIAGCPNAGKSSLFNLLLNKDRAIVSDIKGTTRDYISDHINIADVPIEIFDTAGVHESNSSIEDSGIQKSLNLITNKDLVLFIVDASTGFTPEVFKLFDHIRQKPFIPIVNKIDLNPSFTTDIFSDPVYISITQNSGINILKDRISSFLDSKIPDINTPVLLHTWQKNIIKKIIIDLEELKLQLSSDHIELISFLIKDIFNSLNNLSGKIDDQTIYEKIFKNFCIGK